MTIGTFFALIFFTLSLVASGAAGWMTKENLKLDPLDAMLWVPVVIELVIGAFCLWAGVMLWGVA